MLFITSLFDNPQFFFMHISVVVFSVCCHEYAHAQVALWQGDATAAEQGHLTLNPLKQMGVTPLIILAFVGITWGQVPVNPLRMRHRYSNAVVSFAGPLMNLILFFIFCLSGAISVLSLQSIDAPLVKLLSIGALLNMALFILNMLPVPSLDGWHVYAYFFPKLKDQSSELINGISLFLFMGIFFGGNILFKAADYCSTGLINLFLSTFG